MSSLPGLFLSLTLDEPTGTTGKNGKDWRQDATQIRKKRREVAQDLIRQKTPAEQEKAKQLSDLRVKTLHQEYKIRKQNAEKEEKERAAQERAAEERRKAAKEIERREAYKKAEKEAEADADFYREFEKGFLQVELEELNELLNQSIQQFHQAKKALRTAFDNQITQKDYPAFRKTLKEHELSPEQQLALKNFESALDEYTEAKKAVQTKQREIDEIQLK